MQWVVDCSVAAAVFLPDENSSEAKKILSFCLAKGPFWVPHLWWNEMCNVMLVNTRRGRIEPAIATGAFRILGELDIETDTVFGTEASIRVYQLASESGLTVYDAAYLDLAIRKNTGLATFDKKLSVAASKAGIKLFHSHQK